MPTRSLWSRLRPAAYAEASACQPGDRQAAAEPCEEIPAVHGGLTNPCWIAYTTSSAVLCKPSAFMMLAR